VILSGVMMLEYLGWQEAPSRFARAGKAIGNKTVTYDFARQMGGGEGDQVLGVWRGDRKNLGIGNRTIRAILAIMEAPLAAIEHPVESPGKGRSDDGGRRRTGLPRRCRLFWRSVALSGGPNRHTYTVVLHPGERDEGGFWSRGAGAARCNSQGESTKETIAQYARAIEGYLQCSPSSVNQSLGKSNPKDDSDCHQGRHMSVRLPSFKPRETNRPS